MKSLLKYISENKLAVAFPLLLMLAALIFLAWKVAQTPDSPFIYDY